MSVYCEDLRKLLHRFACDVAYTVVERASGNLGDHGAFCVDCAAEEVVSHIDYDLDCIHADDEIEDVIRTLIESLESLDGWDD